MQLLEELMSTTTTRVVEFSLDANEIGPWHYHSSVDEYCYCLEGVVVIEQKDKESIALKPGEKLQLAAGDIHRLCNFIAQPSRYLVVQGVGSYDFLEV